MADIEMASLNADKSTSIYVAAIVTFTLASIAVPLRVWARKLRSANIWWDDWSIFVSYFFACGVFATTILWLKEGVGKHVEVVLASDPKALTIILKSITPAEICYTLSILFAKYSILGFYSRIFNFSAMKTALIVIFLVVTGWAISVVVVSSVTCIPLAALWDPEIHGKCVDLPKFYLGISFPNVLTDWTMLVLPLPYIWKLQMPKSQKLIVMGVFIVGSFVCVVSLVRLIFIAHLDLVDITWGLVNLDLWTCVECFSAVFCSCLPSLRPVYDTLVGKPQSQSLSGSTVTAYNSKSKSKSNDSRSMWKTSKQGVKPESFVRLQEEEDWVSTTNTAASPENPQGDVTKHHEHIEMNRMDV